MKRKAKQQVMGIILIIISIAILYFNLSRVEGSFSKLWPTFVLLLGMFFYIFYFSIKKKGDRPGLLFLATFLAISCIPLYILSFTSFEHFNVLWPGFLFAIGMGFLAVYFYGKGRKVALLLSFLTIGASIIIWALFSVKYRFGLVTGVVFLIVGAGFLTRGLIREQGMNLEEEGDSMDKSHAADEGEEKD
jgi:hypothetical protein